MTTVSDETTFLTHASTALNQETDRTLLNLAVLGDHSAFLEFFKRHTKTAWTMSLYLLHGSAAADVAVGLVRSVALATVDSYRPSMGPKMWLLSIGIKTCRRIAKSPEIVTSTTRPSTKDASDFSRKYSRRVVIALGHLNPVQREVFVLHFIHDLTYDETAKVLEISTETAKQLGRQSRYVMAKSLAPRSRK